MKVEDMFVEQFKDMDRRPDRKESPLRKIVVFSTPRSGSSFFCHSMAATGLFGHPDEWLNTRRLEAYRRYRGAAKLDLDEYYDYILRKSTSDNGVFTAKIHVDQYMFWKEKNIDVLKLKFDKIIYICRNDKIAQAYSYAKAKKTDQWASFLEPRSGSGQNIPSRSSILDALRFIVFCEEFYQENLSRHVDRVFFYEEIAMGNDFVNDVLNLCQIKNAGHAGRDAILKIQRTEQDKWAVEELKRYLFGLGG